MHDEKLSGRGIKEQLADWVRVLFGPPILLVLSCPPATALMAPKDLKALIPEILGMVEHDIDSQQCPNDKKKH